MSTTNEDKKEERFWTRKKSIAAVLLILAFAVDGFGCLYASVPPVTAPSNIHHVAGYWGNRAPPFQCEIQALFTATGAFSVNNPIHVHATLLNVNITNFLDYYFALSFTDAYDTSVVQSQTETPVSGHLNLTASQTSRGMGYVADGTLVWLCDGPTWPMIIMNPNPSISPVLSSPSVQVGNPILTISSISDTLSIQGSLVEQRLTWILVGFSILMLQPIFEALFVKENPPQEREKPQGLWHQHKLWRKKRSQETQTT
jgi:hypothetical protein